MLLEQSILRSLIILLVKLQFIFIFLATVTKFLLMTYGAMVIVYLGLLWNVEFILFLTSGQSASNLKTCTDTETDTENEEGKFGSNISHLGHYSDIAEKSMERFVSVISSFKYTSSGSRASGLRAPLKDTRNNCSNR